jgi:hypothetical protein
MSFVLVERISGKRAVSDFFLLPPDQNIKFGFLAAQPSQKIRPISAVAGFARPIIRMCGKQEQDLMGLQAD